MVLRWNKNFTTQQDYLLARPIAGQRMLHIPKKELKSQNDENK